MLRTYRSGARSVTSRTSVSIVIAAGGSTVERIANRATSCRELARVEAVHDHDRARRRAGRTARCRCRRSSESDTGTRFGVGGRPSRTLAWPRRRSGPSTRSSSSRYAVCVCRIGFGAPVVPDVHITNATSSVVRAGCVEGGDTPRPRRPRPARSPRRRQRSPLGARVEQARTARRRARRRTSRSRQRPGRQPQRDRPARCDARVANAAATSRARVEPRRRKGSR